MNGKVLKTLRPGSAGAKRWTQKYDGRLVCVRYRGDVKRRVRLTTVEIVVAEGFWDPVGWKNYKKALSSSRQAV
jgi:hypothetical protein